MIMSIHVEISAPPLMRMTPSALSSAKLEWLTLASTLSTITPTSSVICTATQPILTSAATVMKKVGQHFQYWQTVHQASHRHAR